MPRSERNRREQLQNPKSTTTDEGGSYGPPHRDGLKERIEPLGREKAKRIFRLNGHT